MIGTINNWNGGTLGWGCAFVTLIAFYFVAWRQYRNGRARYDRVRERQRREYWGWE